MFGTLQNILVTYRCIHQYTVNLISLHEIKTLFLYKEERKSVNVFQLEKVLQLTKLGKCVPGSALQQDFPLYLPNCCYVVSVTFFK